MMQLFDDQPTERRCAIPLLVELCAGTAALSLRLERAGARPPVSRMGAKTGYADCILALAGLEPGAKAEHYVFCEPDEGVRLLLHAYRNADLAREAAAIIRSWADEEPRALWDRLKAEGPPRCPGVDPREVGRIALMGAWAFRRGEPDSGYNAAVAEGAPATATHHVSPALSPTRFAARLEGNGLPATIHDDATTLDPREVARWTWSAGHCYRKGDLDSGFQGNDPAIGRPRQIAATQAQHLIGGLPAIIHDDATTLDPREVARWAVTWNGSFSGKGPAAGFCPTVDNAGITRRQSEINLAGLLERSGLPATIHDNATTAPIPDALPDGSLVFIDPPYVDTTGYAHDLDRPAVVRLAQQWAAAGARVMISEAVPIEALVACGWHAVEVSAMRVGQKRTFSKQQREWVTMSFAPDRRALRACELAAERAERAAAAMAGGEQRSLFGVP